MILLATDVLDGRPDQRCFGAIDIAVRRNGFGRQIASFEATSRSPASAPAPLHAVFIRAPLVESTGDEVEVLAVVERGADDPGGPGDGVGGLTAVAAGHARAVPPGRGPGGRFPPGAHRRPAGCTSCSYR